MYFEPGMIMDKRIIILGAGLAGTIAYGSLSSYNVEVFESKLIKHAGLSDHFAVMRFRDPDVCKYIGCDAEAITAHKMIEFKGKLYDKATIAMNNMYSLKVSKGLHERSTKDLGKVVRYLAEFKPLNKSIVNYGYNLKSVNKGNRELEFSINHNDSAEEIVKVKYDICISTLPIPFMLEKCGIESKVSFEQERIYITRYKLAIPSTIHQTIYITNPESCIYRATMEGNMLIIETMDIDDKDEINSQVNEYILPLFGVHPAHVKKEDVKAQILGKIIPIDDDLRKVLITELTDAYGIYSFGRHAIWKGIRADNLIEDIEKIKKNIKLSVDRKKYESRLSN